MKFKKPIEVQAGISDGDPTNPLGISGYLLSSDGSNVNWISPGGLSAETAEAIVQPIKANGALSKGDPVYIVGYQAGQNANIVAKADSSVVAKMPVVGLADDDYADSNFGTMTAFGSFNGAFDTTGGTENWAVGDIIFVKPGGGLTNIKPTGTDLIQNVAIVSRVQQNTGELEVIALGRTNDVPNLPTGRLFVGTAANTSLASDVIYVDDTNDRVGIGTDNPTNELTIESASPVIDIKSTNTFPSGQIRFLNSGGNEFSGIQALSNPSTSALILEYKSPGLPSLSSSLQLQSGNLFLSTANQTRMRITSAGDVGIGAPNPSSKLEVNTGADGVISRFRGSTNTGVTISGGTYEGVALSAKIHHESSNRNLVLETNGTGKLYFNTNGANARMVINNSGNVSIGTDTTSAKLEVRQAANNGNTGAFTNTHVKLTATATADNTGFVGITAATSPSDRYGYSFGAQRTSGGQGEFKINYHVDQAAGVNRFIIDQAGEVGIGATSPQAKLHVANGNLRTWTPLAGTTAIFESTQNSRSFITITGANESELWFGDGATQTKGRVRYENNNNMLEFWTNATPRMYINSSGKVGIGVPTPVYQLQLSLNSAAKPTSSAWAVVSDERVKTNIRPYETGLQELLQIEPKLFDYNGKAGFDATTKNNIGVIAQEIKDVMPETVKKYNAKLNEEDEEDTELYNFDSHALTFALINSVKELNAKIKSLETKIQTLENQ